MFKNTLILLILLAQLSVQAQTHPAIISWLQNTSNLMGRHYMKGNSSAINDAVLANIQSVKYSDDWVYITTNGIPAYVTGPFLDGNPSIAQSQNALFKITLKPAKNTGTQDNTTGGNIGIFINGVALFDFRDGVSWHNSSGTIKGGPLGGMGDQVWNRDAIVAERIGFDCAKGHPAMGNYHHHQNPSAFKLDLKVLSTICNLYDADGLYRIDSLKHSPLIGFAYDGFPIYGAIAFKNTDGTGGLVRMKSSYKLRNISKRTTNASGANVTPGPNVDATYPLGYFREDYEFIAPSTTTPDYLDDHNGRFCITPEYPSGQYCYFTTVDQHWNSTYPYAIGPKYYGNRTNGKISSITENVSTYKPLSTTEDYNNKFNVSIYPNPGIGVVAIQYNGLLLENLKVELLDLSGKLILSSGLNQGSTIAFLETNSISDGIYLIRISNANGQMIKKITIKK